MAESIALGHLIVMEYRNDQLMQMVERAYILA